MYDLPCPFQFRQYNRSKFSYSVSIDLSFLAELLERPVSSEMVVFYITQDTQKHPLLPELKSGLVSTSLHSTHLHSILVFVDF